MSVTRRQVLRQMALIPASLLLAGRAVAATPGLRIWAGQWALSGHGDGVGEAATFYDPRGLATDPRNGDIVVADAANALIRRIDGGARVSTVAGQAEQRATIDGPALQAQFVGPDAVCVGPDGTVYIADSYANTIRMLRDGVVSTLAGQAGMPGFVDGVGTQAQFNHPVGLAIDPRSGDLLVADAYNATLRAVDRSGRVRTLGGSPGDPGHRDGALSQALFNTPVGIAAGADGSIVVTEFFNHDLRRIAPDGRVSTLAGTPGTAGDADGVGASAAFSRPQQVCLDARGNAIVVDGGNGKIRRVGVDGRVTTLAGTGSQVEAVVAGPLPGALIAPYGVAVGRDGAIYVSTAQAVVRIDV